MDVGMPASGKPLIKNALLCGAAVLAFAVMQRLSAELAFSVFGLHTLFPAESGAELLIGTVCTYVFGAGSCALILSLTDKTETVKRGVRPAAAFETLLIAVGVVYLGNIAGIAVTTALSGKTIAVETVFGSDLLTNIAVTVVIAPVAEETIFRKMLIPRLLPFGERTAVVFSALAFALLHGNFQQFFYAFGFGILCGFIFVRTGRAAFTVALHMIINAFGGIVVSFVKDKLKNLKK